MKKPNPLNRDKLRHPKDKRSAFNGDRIRSKDEQGFASRRASQGLRVVEGTVAPTNVKSTDQKTNNKETLTNAPLRYSRPPTARQRAEDDALAFAKAKKPLTERQKRQMRGK